MGAGPFELIIWVFFIGLFVLNYFIAKKLNTNHKILYPDHQDYKWGYFMGVSGVVGGTLYCLFYLFTLIMVFEGFQEIGLYVLILALYLIPVILGYFVCKKSKQAIILATVFSLNPVIWIINFFYIKKRQGDFFEQEKNK